MAVFRRRFSRGARRVPLKKKTRSTDRSTLVSKWGNISTTGISVPRGVLGFPGSLTTVIRYNDTYNISTVGSAVSGQVMRMNSVFDPDYTGIGHQALYFDQFAAVYDQYVVLASRVDVKFSPLSITGGPYVIGITSGNQVGFSSTQYTLSEQSKSSSTALGSVAGTSVARLSQTYDPLTCLGVSADDDTVQSSTSNNPTKQWYAYCWAQDKSAAGAVIVAHVTVTYRVRFFGMKNVTSS